MLRPPQMIRNLATAASASAEPSGSQGAGSTSSAPTWLSVYSPQSQPSGTNDCVWVLLASGFLHKESQQLCPWLSKIYERYEAVLNVMTGQGLRLYHIIAQAVH